MKRETRNLQLCFMEMEGYKRIEAIKVLTHLCKKVRDGGLVKRQRVSSDSPVEFDLSMEERKSNCCLLRICVYGGASRYLLIISRSNGKCLTYNSPIGDQERFCIVEKCDKGSLVIYGIVEARLYSLSRGISRSIYPVLALCDIYVLTLSSMSLLSFVWNVWLILRQFIWVSTLS